MGVLFWQAPHKILPTPFFRLFAAAAAVFVTTRCLSNVRRRRAAAHNKHQAANYKLGFPAHGGTPINKGGGDGVALHHAIITFLVMKMEGWRERLPARESETD